MKLPTPTAALLAAVLLGLVASTTALTSATPARAQGYAYMGCSQLWYARNAIYARKGYCFRTARARAVFGPRCYPPYGRLNAWEQRQVNIIINWEYRKGCR